MINLAGNKDCDDVIIDELTKAGISVVKHQERLNREVPTRITGKLGDFTFGRAWYYWVVGGKVPLSVAKLLYRDKIGKRDVRVTGHAGCPPPEDWVKHLDKNGILLYPKSELEGYDPKSKVYKMIMSDEESRPVEDPTSEGKPFILCYHIDSQEGLNFFVKTIRKNNLVS